MDKYDWVFIAMIVMEVAIKLGVIAFALYLAWLLVTGIIA